MLVVVIVAVIAPLMACRHFGISAFRLVGAASTFRHLPTNRLAEMPKCRSADMLPPLPNRYRDLVRLAAAQVADGEGLADRVGGQADAQVVERLHRLAA